MNKSAEDYLKIIALLGAGERIVRVTDISKVLHIKPASVTEALVKLVGAGLVKHQKHGRVELTAEGGEIARDVSRRFELSYKLLVDVLGVPSHVAEKDACQMEHTLSQASREKLEKFLFPPCMRGKHGYRNKVPRRS